MSPSDIAEWHLKGREQGTYPALISTIELDDRGLKYDIGFEELSKNDTLARDFPEKCAFSVRANPDARFSWSATSAGKSRVRSYTNSGYGGAARTAAKLLSEAERAKSLAQEAEIQDEFSPIQILLALSAARPDARLLQTRLTRSLS